MDVEIAYDMMFAENKSLRAELNEAADATGIAGVDEPMSLLQCIQSLRAELEGYKSALREITGIGPSFDAKGTQSRRIDKIARRALDGEESSDA